MFGKVERCVRGVMIEYDDSWYLVQGVGCNPFIEANEFDPILHCIVTRQVYLPPMFYPVVNDLSERQRKCLSRG